jgi:hypothetical protein
LFIKSTRSVITGEVTSVTTEEMLVESSSVNVPAASTSEVVVEIEFFRSSKCCNNGSVWDEDLL